METHATLMETCAACNYTLVIVIDIGLSGAVAVGSPHDRRDVSGGIVAPRGSALARVVAVDP
jgi:hypothetical protein